MLEHDRSDLGVIEPALARGELVDVVRGPHVAEALGTQDLSAVSGVLAKYARAVGSAADGAVCM